MDMDYKQMVRNAVLNASCGKGWNYQYKWKCVADTLGVGRTTAFKLCEKYGKDPDEKLDT